MKKLYIIIALVLAALGLLVWFLMQNKVPPFQGSFRSPRSYSAPSSMQKLPGALNTKGITSPGI